MNKFKSQQKYIPKEAELCLVMSSDSRKKHKKGLTESKLLFCPRCKRYILVSVRRKELNGKAQEKYAVKGVQLHNESFFCLFIFLLKKTKFCISRTGFKDI